MNEEHNSENKELQFANYFNKKKRQKEFDEGNRQIEIPKKRSRYRRYKEIMKGESQDIRNLSNRIAGEDDYSKNYNLGFTQSDQLVATDGGDPTVDSTSSGQEGEKAKVTGKQSEESIFDVLLPEWFKGGKDLGKFTFRSMAKTARTCLPCCAGPLAGAVMIFFTIIVIILWLFGIA